MQRQVSLYESTQGFTIIVDITSAELICLGSIHSPRC